MGYTLGQAATATGKTKSAISKRIKKGDISAQFENGQYDIDPAELHRVFPPVSSEQDNDPSTGILSIPLETQFKIKTLEQEVQHLNEKLTVSNEALESERLEKNRLLGIVEKQGNLLSVAQEQTQQRSSWWPLFRRKKAS